MIGRNTGPLGAVSSTGRPVRYHALDVYELDAGKVVRAWVYAERAELALQPGLDSARPLPGQGHGPD